MRQTTIAQTDQTNFTTYENPTFGIRIQYPSDWGRLDLSFLEASADIDFYPLDDTSGAKDVRIQVKTLPSQNMTLEQYTNTQIEIYRRPNFRIKCNYTSRDGGTSSNIYEYRTKNNASLDVTG